MSKFDNTDKGSYYKRKTNYRNIQSAYPGQSYFCDWVVFNEDSTRTNYNNKYILTVVDAYSRYLFMRISKTNNAQDVIELLTDIFHQHSFNLPDRANTQTPAAEAGSIEEANIPFEDGRYTNIPHYIVTDAGKEFMSADIQAFFKQNKIQHIVLQGQSKSNLAERVIYDLKMYIRNKGKRWYHKIDDFVDFYNNKLHSVTKKKPADVFLNGERPRIRTQKLSKRDDTKQFEVGDQVRIKVDKNAQKIVKRSLTSNWSDKIYTITEVDDKQYPIMYKVKDSDNHLVRRKYYHFELLLVK